jgi:hypothetical protein
MTDKPNYKVWVKSWAEIIRDCESRLKFVQDTLRIEVSAEEIRSRIADLKSSVMRLDEDTVTGAAGKPKRGGKANLDERALS